GAEDHWLPPDNYQENPVSSIAHRTSPTNMGLALLANLSAYDFGYLTAAQLLQRTGQAFQTMESLERHQGHFYNWYDTQTLKPLSPLYVSTVDSGNLVAHMLTLAPGLAGLADKKILAPRLFGGLLDTSEVFRHVVNDAASQNPNLTKPAILQASELMKELDGLCAFPPTTLSAARTCLEQLVSTSAGIRDSFKDLPESHAMWWSDALVRQCQAALEDLTFLAPWTLVTHPPDLNGSLLNKIPTLRELATWNSEFLSVIEHSSNAALRKWLDEVKPLINEASHRAENRLREIETLASHCKEFARVEYDFLYDEARHLMTIGFNVSAQRRDSSYYDLLASEARLASFVAIAQGLVPQENWFSLGRQLTNS
ncbi:MAG TPA: hypothetical protein VN679_11955, partial [Candidatus Acidoferrales bacterium]|nr:hypothetical protein [Candidatus Acidoferrales bacterium]